MAEVDRLETVIGLEEDPSNPAVESKFLSRLSGIFDAAKAGAVALGKGVLASATALAAWTTGVASSVAESSKFARESGIAYEKLQEWEYAAKASGVSSDALRGDISKLYKDMNQLWPSEATWRMGMYGIKTKDAAGKARDASDVLIDLSAKMQGLSTARQLDLGQKLGLSDDTMRLLRQGPDAIRALGAEARSLGLIIPESTAAQAEKFMGTMRKTRAVMEGLAFKLGIAFLPAMSQLLEKFSAWIMSNQEWISLGIQAVAEGVAKSFEVIGHILSGLVSMFTDLLGPVGQLVPGLELADVVSMALTAAFTGLIAIGAVFVAKFALIGLAVGLVAAVIEDLVYFIQGKPSLFGEWWEEFESKYPAIVAGLRSIGEFIQSLVVPAFNLLKSAANLVVTAIGAIIDIALRVIQTLLELGAMDVFAAMGKYIRTLIVDIGALFDALASFDLSAIGAAFTNLFGNALANMGEVVTAVLSMFGNIADAAAAAIASAFSEVFTAIKAWFSSMADWVVGKFNGLKSVLPEWLGGGGEETPADTADSSANESKPPQPQTPQERAAQERQTAQFRAAQEPYVPPSLRVAQPMVYAPVPHEQPVAGREREQVPRSVTTENFVPPVRTPLETAVAMGDKMRQSAREGTSPARVAQPVQAPALTSVSNNIATTNNNPQTSKQDTTINQTNNFNITASDPNAAGTSVQGAMTSPQFLQQLSPGNNAPTFRG